MHTEDYILDALEMVSAWDIPDEDFADAVNAQARLMAGIQPDELLGGPCNHVVTDSSIHSLPSTLPSFLSKTPISMHPEYSGGRRSSGEKLIVLFRGSHGGANFSQEIQHDI